MGLAWMRGALPLLNRFGQSVPPLMMSRRIKIMPREEVGLCRNNHVDDGHLCRPHRIWLVPGIIEPHTGLITWLIPLLYLVLYAAFFMAVGVNQLTYNTIQGNSFESPTAVGC